MTNRKRALLALTLLAFIAQCDAVKAQNAARISGSGSVAGTLVVELFTSDGCSSCPRADAVLETLRSKNVITISEHVDYWNHLGWVDTMSAPIFTQRQKQYAKALGEKDIYTPQMVVGGRQGFVGSQVDTARSAVSNQANHCSKTLNLTAQLKSGNKMAIQIKGVGKMPTKDQKLVVFAVEDNVITLIKAGENGGHIIVHTDVARAMKIIENVSGECNEDGDLEVVLPGAYCNPSLLKAVAFIQNSDDMHITAAGITAALDRSEKHN